MATKLVTKLGDKLGRHKGFPGDLLFDHKRVSVLEFSNQFTFSLVEFSNQFFTLFLTIIYLIDIIIYLEYFSFTKLIKG